MPASSAAYSSISSSCAAESDLRELGEGFSIYDHTGQLPRGLTTIVGVNDAASIAPGS